MYDTIIIGAGMSGLAAGIRLAYYDQKVCILERHYTIGGLNSFYRLNGRDHDVGLHAVTNFTPRGAKKGPLAKLLRQLRFRWEDFALAPQIGSAIAFPNTRLEFGNGLELLTEEIAREFPSQVDPFQRLVARILDYDDLDDAAYEITARGVMGEVLTEPLLIEMLLCPLLWYGSASEHDMPFGQFCIMFRSIFMEGLARPAAGVRLIIKNLVRRYRSLGGELKLRSGVQRIVTEGDRAVGVVLDDGTELAARRVLSSAGWPETMRLCDIPPPEGADARVGQISFAETISILDRTPASLGLRETITFFNDSPQMHWERSEPLCDERTGVICSPNNFAYEGSEGEPPSEGIVRVTAMANHRLWCELPEEEYRLAKLHWFDRVQAAAVRFVPDYRRHIIDTDMFTPKTITRFTWHDNGAVYGAPKKQLDGTTHLENLYLCGTDQGFVGIIGAIMSGISISNRYCLG